MSKVEFDRVVYLQRALSFSNVIVFCYTKRVSVDLGELVICSPACATHTPMQHAAAACRVGGREGGDYIGELGTWSANRQSPPKVYIYDDRIESESVENGIKTCYVINIA
jgi:hypothetical protein